ncbi:SpaA isopeptide-forming pilin-related protein [Bifidobacterium sp. ESL0800]|uniref:SpaA isopeptide-forming pilin-related protein n=1 Tax=Bifidobacterium sp. ESL0800 TaxID=2983236 RepID=UPI0023F8001E|nr:SpaA isopeptide-forming pilin-related protein [Bifidobacterium sp. ESL0800]WEV75446.1 SpaA isopeptide-forming pilin-related protein [Bifidobacterium sp. ESL0800]
MKVGTSLRKTLGVAISAATLLALIPLGAVSANAADEDVPDAAHMALSAGNDATLTVNAPKASYVAGRSFSALRIGTYDMAAKATDTAHSGQLAGLSVGTVNDSDINSAATAAYTKVTTKDLAKEYAGNPVGQIAATMLGYSAADTLITNGDTTSAAAPYTGKLRDVAQELAGNSGSLKAKFASSPYTGTVTDKKVTFSGLPQGLYIIRDMSTSIPANSQVSAPMIVGTAVFENGNTSGYTKFANGDGTELGVVNVKDDEVTIGKTADQTSIPNGSWGKFHVTTTVPVTGGFKHYVFKVTDTPSKGFTLPNPDTSDEADKANYDAHKLKVYVKEKADDPLSDTNLLNNGTNDNTYYTATLTQGAPGSSSSIVVNFGDNLLNHPDVYKPGYTIEITYSLKKNTDANNPTNSVGLNHSTVDTCSTADAGDCTTADVDGPTITTHTYGFKLKNVLRDKTTALKGAVFTIAPKDTPDQPIEFFDAGNGKYTTEAVAGQTAKSGITVTSDDGTLAVDGLAEGTYDVKQTGAASSPQKLRDVMLPHFRVTLTPTTTDTSKNTVTISVTQDIWHLVEKSVDKSSDVVVTNVPSVINLPLTGGAGIVLAVIVVAVLALLFVGSEVLKRRHDQTTARRKA